jgi:ribonuclease BN (tRNA processing enzyme)
MHVTFLGTGVSLINRKRRPSGILLHLDAGPGIAQILAEMEYSASRIRYIFLTHFHLDHTNDYATLVNDRAFTTRERLNFCGPRGLEKHSTLLFNHVYPEVASTLLCYDHLRIKEAVPCPIVTEPNWQVSCGPTEHADGIAYRIDSGHQSLLHSGDTEPCQTLLDLGHEVALAILECSFPDLTSLKGKHLYPAMAAEPAKRMKAKRLVLTHMYPECEGREYEMLNNIKSVYDGEVILAEDGMKIAL